MFGIIVKTALKILLVLLALAIAAFIAVSFALPGSMAEFFEKQGNYAFAKGYASLQYSYSGEVEDLARCVQDCILAEDDYGASKRGAELIKHENFDGLCERETERLGFDYRQYICGKLACVQYRRGDKDGAVDIANTAVLKDGKFSKNNALVQLAVAVSEANDKEGAQKVKAAVENCGGEGEYYEATVAALGKIINGTDGASL